LVQHQGRASTSNFIQDEFDDKMIAAIQIQSMNYEDENFTPVFTRAKQEMFLELSEEAKSSINRVKFFIM